MMWKMFSGWSVKLSPALPRNFNVSFLTMKHCLTNLELAQKLLQVKINTISYSITSQNTLHHITLRHTANTSNHTQPQQISHYSISQPIKSHYVTIIDVHFLTERTYFFQYLMHLCGCIVN